MDKRGATCGGWRHQSRGHISTHKHWLQAGQLNWGAGLGEALCGQFPYCPFSGEHYIELIKCLETTPDSDHPGACIPLQKC